MPRSGKSVQPRRLPTRALAGCAVSAFATCFAALPARADTEPIGIDYRAPPECPSADEFTTQVLERTDSARLAEEAGVRTFVVTIEKVDREVHGSLSIREPDGTSSVARNLDGSHCAEVALALALATALAIDPQATFAPRAEEPKPAESSVSPTPIFDEPPDDVPPPPPADHATTPAAVGIGPAFEAGVAPTIGFGGSLLGEGRFENPVLGSLGLDLTLLTVPTHRTSGATSSFDLVHARPHACLFPLAVYGSLRVLSCVGSELGVIRGRGSDLPQPKEFTRFWVAATLGPRLLSELTGTWFLDVSPNVVIPIRRYRFHFEGPDTEIHQVASVTFSVGLHFGTRL